MVITNKRINIYPLDFSLPFPPTVNNYYSHTRNGVFISKKGRIYRAAAAEILNEQFPRVDFVALSQPINVTVTLFPPDQRTRDLDNYMKCLLDAITHAELWIDDSIIDQLLIFRGEISPRNGFCNVSINPALPLVPIKPTE